MKKGIILLILCAFAWTGFGSWYWTCKVQHDCLESVVEIPVIKTVTKVEKPVPVVEPLKKLPQNLFDPGFAVYFDSNKDELKDGAHARLKSFVQQIEGGDYLGVNIKGHADVTGPEVINKALSINRANRVQKFLEYHGVQNCQVVSEGFSSKFPVQSNSTSEGRKMNRRVELTLYK